MQYRFSGLPVELFQPLFGLDDAKLAEMNIRRVVADAKPGFPCRITLEDAEPGERLLLLAHEHQPAHSPYRASGPIFVRESARKTYDGSALPPVFRGRFLSVRAYDAGGMMIDAEVVEGNDSEPLFERMFASEDVAYLHVHNARRGCFSARVDRA